MRPLLGLNVFTAFIFQLTHPTRGATAKFVGNRYCKKFQLTHPTRGATGTGAIVVVATKFQLTHPTRGATHW